MIFVDTSVLVRLLDTDANARDRAVHTFTELDSTGETLVTSAQCLMEFWVVATRPRAVNGLGMTQEIAEFESDRFESILLLLEEPPDVFLRWKLLVRTHNVLGKPSHDARIVAFMQGTRSKSC